MELRELLQLWWRYRSLFAAVVAGFVLAGAVFRVVEPKSYQAALLLNIGRSGSEETTEYSYEAFYRLQADERFADTVVRWLQSPRVVADIKKEAGISEMIAQSEGLAQPFRARRLSSQVIEVTLVSSETETLRALSGAAIRVLNRYTESLNVGNEASRNWFVVLGSEPVLSDARTSPAIIFLLSLFGGVVAGWFVIAGRVYVRGAS